MSWLIGVLVLAGVLAGLAGDRLGHRLGKKRVSLFNLRPRHTGVLATSITGALIALVLSPIALWGAGFFNAPPEPIVMRVPVVAHRQMAHADAPGATRPQAVAATQAPSSLAHAESRQMVATTSLPLHQQSEHTTQPLTKATSPRQPSAPVVIAPGELLGAVEIPGGLGTAATQQALHEVLASIGRFAQRRGAGAVTMVANQQLADATAQLQGTGAYTVHVQAGRAIRTDEPLVLQLTVHAQPGRSLAEVQERDRVEHSAAAAQAAIDQALAQAPASGAVASLPDEAYTPIVQALAATEHRTRLVWLREPTAGGPLLMRIGPTSEH